MSRNARPSTGRLSALGFYGPVQDAIDVGAHLLRRTRASTR